MCHVMQHVRNTFSKERILQVIGNSAALKIRKTTRITSRIKANKPYKGEAFRATGGVFTNGQILIDDCTWQNK